MPIKATCRECALLIRELASATFEVTAIQKDILARDRKTTSPEDATRLRNAKQVAQEAVQAIAEHSLSHEIVPEGLSGVAHRRVLWPQAISSLLYVNNYYQAFHGHITSPFSHTWSLGIEEQFYLLWPCLFLLFRNSYRRLARMLCGLIFAFWVYRALLVLGFRTPEVYLYEAFDARADHLLVGCLLAVTLRADYLPNLWRGLCSRSGMALIVVGCLLASNGAEYVYGHSYRDTIGAIVDPILTAVFVVQMIAMANTRMWGWMNSRIMRYLGRISYSIYLYQAIVMAAPKKLLGPYPVFVQLAGCVAVVVIVASVSHVLIERPFLALRKGFRNSDAKSNNPALAIPATKLNLSRDPQAVSGK
jgi:peptidoglycan/LPS O-acetylase OafA/YrhL